MQKHRIYDNVFHILRAGHRKLAASIINDVKDNTFYGFNNLHHQVLLFDNEELTINRAASVTKKTKDNFQVNFQISMFLFNRIEREFR